MENASDLLKWSRRDDTLNFLTSAPRSHLRANRAFPKACVREKLDGIVT